MTYRTKTYLAGDWTGDITAINQIKKWNDSRYWSLSFNDAHELTQARDTSLNCSIKKSLKDRMDVSKTFVLIIGNGTKFITAGSCRFCKSYNSWTKSCARYHTVNQESYINYECNLAIEAGIKIVVLYNSTKVDKSKCPDSLVDSKIHIPMLVSDNYGKTHWNYDEIKNALQ